MQIVPAIDLYAGKCVRLLQGKFTQLTTYPDDPIALAQTYAAQGARRLHVVDLNGAQQGTSSQLATILAIKAATSLSVQVGGGIRSIDAATQLLQQGIDQVVIGSMVITAPQHTLQLLETFGASKIILALDVTITDMPYVTTHGWQQASHESLWTVLARYQHIAGLQVLCTDIAKDGVLAGPNFNLYQQIITRFPGLQLIASGGISSLQDLVQLQACGATAVVIGKALYEKHFTVAQAINETSPC